MSYNPLSDKYLTIATVKTKNGQKDVRVILEVDTNIFYTLDDDGNFIPIAYSFTATDVFVTGGTYVGNDLTFTNNTGGTFNVSGSLTIDASAVTYDNTTVQNAIDEIVDANLNYSSNKQMLFNPDGFVGTSLLADTLYARLVKAEGDLSITLMSGRYSAAAVGNGIFGIYTIGSNGLPDALLATSAEVDTNITIVQNVLLDVPQTLKKGYYALVYNSNVTNNFNCSPAASVNPNFGYNPTILAAGNFTCYVASHTYTGTLPLTFPSGAFQTINAPFILVQ